MFICVAFSLLKSKYFQFSPISPIFLFSFAYSACIFLFDIMKGIFKTSKTKGAFLLLVGFYALIAQSVLVGYSLCFSELGSVTLETSVGECCSKDAHNSNTTRDIDSGEDCTSCLDIQLTNEIQYGISQNSGSLGLLSFKFQGNLAPPIIKAIHSATLPARSSFLAYRCTTVLLI